MAAYLIRRSLILLVSLLVAGLVHLNARRTETIRREVQLRTAELGESRRQLASLLHELPGMAYRGTYDDQLALQFVSEGAFALTGWTAEEFIGGSPLKLRVSITSVSPSQRPTGLPKYLGSGSTSGARPSSGMKRWVV